MLDEKESDEFLEDWVEDKLDQGVEKQRLKRILDETDRDPEVVDKVSSPFDSDDEQRKSEEGQAAEEGSSDGLVSRFLS